MLCRAVPFCVMGSDAFSTVPQPAPGKNSSTSEVAIRYDLDPSARSCYRRGGDTTKVAQQNTLPSSRTFKRLGVEKQGLKLWYTRGGRGLRNVSRHLTSISKTRAARREEKKEEGKRQEDIRGGQDRNFTRRSPNLSYNALARVRVVLS